MRVLFFAWGQGKKEIVTKVLHKIKRCGTISVKSDFAEYSCSCADARKNKKKRGKRMKKFVPVCLLCLAVMLATSLTAFAIPTSTMRLGSKGAEVKELQQKLAEEGLLEDRFVTGFFGPNTEQAVRDYQKKNGINQTGVVAEKTLEAMFTDKTIDPKLVLRNGDENEQVLKLQKALFSMGYLDETSVTGYFGDKTEAAVKKFQGEKGISQTGVAAEKTLTKINTLIDGTKLEVGRAYSAGDNDEGVKTLQRRLFELGYLEEKYITGYYGAITVAAVKKFQKNNQITQTGTVAQLTLTALNSASAKTVEIDKTAVDIILKPGTLRYGDSGPQVKTLQQNLKKLGYFSGTATGEFGDVTKQAVTRFQKAYSLTADGIVNAKTQTKITAALAAKTASAKSSSSSASVSASSSGVTVSGYDSANMALINSALATLTEAQLEDIRLMARVIKREVGGSSYKCQLAVGSVIMNRVRRTGASVHDILYSPHQFSTVNASLPNETYSTSNYYAAIEAYMGVQPIGNCLYFCYYTMRYSSWMGKNRTFYCMIGTECFFL